VSGTVVNTQTGARAGGGAVTVYGRVYPGTAYRALRTVRVASDGTWRAGFTMTAHTVFYARVAATATYAAATSPKALVVVTTTVTRTSPANGVTLRYGTRLVVTGTTTPHQPGSLVYLVERFADGRVAALASARIATDGTFRLSRDGLARGWHVLYVQAAGTSYTSGGVSPVFGVRVT
jgi:hypothetical protein